MPTWTPLSKNDHQDAKWTKFTDYNFAAQDAAAPLLVAELAQALPHYPLAFTQDVDSRFRLVALQSLQPSLNLFVGPKGQWLAPYVPSHYRGYPYRMLQNEQKEWVLCFDADSNLVRSGPDAQGQPLLESSGELSSALKPVVDFLQQCQNSAQLTQSLVDTLQKENLIEPWPINLKTDKEAAQSVQGLYRINEEQLKTRPPQALSDLAKSGALGLAYAQLLSQARLSDLQKRYTHHTQSTKVEDIDLDTLFGENNEDNLFI